MAPPAGARLTVVVDRTAAVYSGMVPGFVAGWYRADELEIDVRPLALRAGARFIVAAATGLDVNARRIHVDGRPPIAYDTASFDVGSTVAGLDLPGVRERALPTRPIAGFVERVEAALAPARERSAPHVVVVGAGAGGVELAFTLHARLRRDGVHGATITLLEAGARVLPGYPTGAAGRVLRHAAARGIRIRCGARVAAAREGALALEGGEALPCDVLVWVTGAASLGLFAAAGLPTDPRGFVRVGATLQVEGHDELFAVGDCASLRGASLAKAGVYAVRQGPVLTRNLMARVTGAPGVVYWPQRDFLTLLNLGDGSAVAAKWGVTAEGRWAFRLKDWIDRRFMRRFQVLGPSGALSPEFAGPPSMAGQDMVCGGCAAKVGESVLSRALARLGAPSDPAVLLGLAEPDDAAAVATPRGEIVASTVDGFRAFTDDPYVVGRVAALNAASDLWAKGVSPRFALAEVSVPASDPERQEETLYQALAGARAALDAEGITLVGGHTTTGDDLSVGFAVFGFAASAGSLMRLGGLEPGDRLVLTKPLGTGVLFYADARGLARGAWIQAALASMLRANAVASRVAVAGGATACTDVSGFGLAGHLGEMLRAAKAGAVVDLDALPLLPGAAELFGRGHRSTFHPENARARRALSIAPEAAARPTLDVLFDPQTSGGLLFGVRAARVAEVVAALRAGGDVSATVIGEVGPARPDGALFEVVAGGPASTGR